MSLFRTATLSMFSDARALEIKEFSEKAWPVIRKHAPDTQFLIDTITECPGIWNVLDDEPWMGNSNPLTEANGSLDFVAACIAEGKHVYSVWDNIACSYREDFQNDLVEFGLHSIHFRMSLKNESDRITYTCKLANLLFEMGSASSRVGIVPITGLSLLTENLDNNIYQYMDSDARRSSSNYTNFSAEEITVLTAMAGRGNMSTDQKILFKKSVIKMFFNGDTVQYLDTHTIAFVIEEALIPLVYNHGYKLKSQGVPNAQVIADASWRIETLLSLMPPNPAFLDGLKRQILINLFSAFPDGLELLEAKPEELQGVMLNPNLIHDPMAKFFKDTLAGPIALFTPKFSAPVDHRVDQIVDFFRDTPYPLHLDLAVYGYLLKNPQIVQLAQNCHGKSQALEDLLMAEGNGFVLPINLAKYMIQPEPLERYSDQAVLKLISFAIDVAISQRDRAQKRPTDTTPAGYASVAPVLRDRPHLIEPLIKILEEKDCLHATMFEWCGFGIKELKALGERAPDALKAELLEDSMGL